MSVHLMVRSAYTLLKSSLRVEDIVNEAVRQGYDAVALSDYEVMHGAMAFYHACPEAGDQGHIRHGGALRALTGRAGGIRRAGPQ